MPLNTGKSAKKGNRRPLTFWVSLTIAESTTTGHYTVHKTTIGKRMTAKLKDIKAKLRKRLPAGLTDEVKWLQQVLRGYFQYHAIAGNTSR